MGRLERLREAFEDLIGLEQARRRLLERAALRLRFGPGSDTLPVICGPRGAGGQALIDALARGLGWPVVRIDLRTVDEAELRGRSRAAGGSEPGRFAQCVPEHPDEPRLVILEHLDTLATGGNQRERLRVAAAVLEAVRGELRDRYLGSRVASEHALWIGTARRAEALSQWFDDAVEPICVYGYDREQKLQIARRAIVPEVRRATGLPEAAVRLGEGVLEALVDRYDLEPGVRRLRRLITTIFRRVGAQIALGERPPGEFSHDELEPLLGPPAPEAVVGSAQRRAEVGRAAGLARTVEGGRVTWVEALQAEPAHTLPAFPTGVRAEALAAAFAFVRSHAQQLRVDPDSLRPERVRVGLASPATLDESARAGLDLATLLALASLASDRPVRPDVAAVGGLTLRGELTPIEGLPEMVLAAGRCGIRTVLVPAVSHGALVRELSPSTLAGLRLVAVDTAAEAARRSLIDIVIARGIESESA